MRWLMTQTNANIYFVRKTAATIMGSALKIMTQTMMMPPTQIVITTILRKYLLMMWI